MSALLEVRNLNKYFKTGSGASLHAVENVSFSIERGKTMGIVGESGCGKSTLGRTILRLHEPTSGKILFDGMDVSTFSRSEMRIMRKNMQMVFQDPYASLDTRLTIGKLIEEPLRLFNACGSKIEYTEKVDHLMELVGLSKYMRNMYPHEFDGGRRQRVVIARALALNPQFIVCDEPVSALDVSVQAQILNLLMELQENLGLTYVFISHDLSVIKHISDEVGVMYSGLMIEKSKQKDIFANPLHPYTIALLSAIPSINVEKKSKRIILKGEVASPIDPKPGCRFASRCPFAQEQCTRETPELQEVTPSHFVACHRSEEIRSGSLNYEAYSI